MDTIAIILAGGVGNRFKSSVPKQFVNLNGKIIINYTLLAFLNSQQFHKIIIVCDKKYRHLISTHKTIMFANNGKNRTESVWNGLKLCPNNTKIVMVHDAIRPFITVNDINWHLTNVKTGVITSRPIVDSLAKNKNNHLTYVDRSAYCLIQTPETFDYKLLMETYNYKKETFGIYEHLINNNIVVYNIPHSNLKITYPEDLTLAEQLMKYSPVTPVLNSVKGKKVLVLGSNGGIGMAVIECLKKSGANVIAYNRQKWDLTARYSYELCKDLKNCDCVINCAGICKADNHCVTNDMDKILSVNFKNVVVLCELAYTYLKKNSSIVLIGSSAITRGRERFAIYSASKIALNSFVESYAPRLLEKNIYLNIINPERVNTSMIKVHEKVNKNKLLNPDDVAGVIIRYVNTQCSGKIVHLRKGML